MTGKNSAKLSAVLERLQPLPPPALAAAAAAAPAAIAAAAREKARHSAKLLPPRQTGGRSAPVTETPKHPGRCCPGHLGRLNEQQIPTVKILPPPHSANEFVRVLPVWNLTVSRHNPARHLGHLEKFEGPIAPVLWDWLALVTSEIALHIIQRRHY